MAELVGLSYVTSAEKIALDERIMSVLGPPGAFLEGTTESSLSRYFGTDSDGIYYDERVGPDGNTYKLPKIQTMREKMAGESDLDIAYSKNNPRIVSLGAHLVRDIGLDELPQLRCVPDPLSLVGPRPSNQGYLDFSLDIVKRVDRGVSAAWEELYFYPGIRHGLSGPGQLRLAWYNDRSPKTIAQALRADVDYYPEKASNGKDIAIILRTPLELASSSLWKRLYNLKKSYTYR